MRGAIAVALVYYYFDPQGMAADSHRSTIIATTLIVVLFSTVVFSAATKPLLEFMLGAGRLAAQYRQCRTLCASKKLSKQSKQSKTNRNTQNRNQQRRQISVLQEKPPARPHTYRKVEVGLALRKQKPSFFWSFCYVQVLLCFGVGREGRQ